jgi:hypothetical protein
MGGIAEIGMGATVAFARHAIAKVPINRTADVFILPPITERRVFPTCRRVSTGEISQLLVYPNVNLS